MNNTLNFNLISNYADCLRKKIANANKKFYIIVLLIIILLVCILQSKENLNRDEVDYLYSNEWIIAEKIDHFAENNYYLFIKHSNEKFIVSQDKKFAECKFVIYQNKETKKIKCCFVIPRQFTNSDTYKRIRFNFKIDNNKEIETIESIFPEYFDNRERNATGINVTFPLSFLKDIKYSKIFSIKIFIDSKVYVYTFNPNGLADIFRKYDVFI